MEGHHEVGLELLLRGQAREQRNLADLLDDWGHFIASDAVCEVLLKLSEIQ